MEIEIDRAGAEVRVIGRGSRGERPAPQPLGAEPERLEAFAKSVRRAVESRRLLSPAVLAEAQALHEALVRGELRDALMRLTEAAAGGQVIVKLFIRDGALQAIPWEALCRPGTDEGFLGSSSRLLCVRGVTSAEAWEPREVRGPIRVLAVSPSSGAATLGLLEDALGEAIGAGEIEWLDPVAGEQAGQRPLFERLRRGPSPHVIHFLGHGGIDGNGHPALRLADDDDGEESWCTAAALGNELAEGFRRELRLVYLEACEGARPGTLASAGEILARAGADAVVAHLWPVKADAARAGAAAFYQALAGAQLAQGDAGKSLVAARRTLLAAGSAEGFSPVLYLRAPGAALFDFERRRVTRPGARTRAASALDPALLSLLGRPFSLVLGDLHEDRAELRRELSRLLTDGDDGADPGLPLCALTQRCALRFGEETLSSLFQQATLGGLRAAAPPLIEALGRQLGPGVHTTLLQLPLLESVVARAQPSRMLYAVQPPVRGVVGRPRVVKRDPGAPTWKLIPALPKELALERDMVILRLSGGYTPERAPIFTSPALTEDDYIQGLIGLEGLRVPEWANELLAVLRSRPALFADLSVHAFQHRMLLRWLFDQRPVPKDSLAILDPGADTADVEIWESGAGLPGAGCIGVVRAERGALAAQLDALPDAETSRS
jgi:CHAT domain-containing protein